MAWFATPDSLIGSCLSLFTIRNINNNLRWCLIALSSQLTKYPTFKFIFRYFLCTTLDYLLKINYVYLLLVLDFTQTMFLSSFASQLPNELLLSHVWIVTKLIHHVYNYEKHFSITSFINVKSGNCVVCFFHLSGIFEVHLYKSSIFIV